jgi:hypothetical protein
MKNKYYLYRHIRLDNNEPFYIGIGSKTKQDLIYDSYKRAYTKHKRNKFWYNIILKTDYKVEILYECNDYKFIKQKEIEFITLYGRRDLGLGTLVNFTNGGEGTVGIIVSPETRKNMSISKLGKKINKSKGWYASKNMSPEIWKNLKNEYLTTNIKIKELSKKYNYSACRISTKFKKENIKVINIGNCVSRNKERNKKIYEDYNSGLYSLKELTMKYNFKDRQSIYQSIETYKKQIKN